MIALESLYAAVFAAPGDDGPRHVLADALQEQGDPRGEFISLQLQQRRTQRSERRMTKLLERHRTDFLRRLAPIVMPGSTQKWERGFLAEASVVLEGRHVDVPDLATLRSLEVVFSPAAPLELASPHMRSLREVSMASLSAVPVLFDAPRLLDVEVVGLSGPAELSAWPEETVALVGEARTLPKLNRLLLRASRPNADEAAWVWQLPVLSRLRTLEFDGSFRGVPLHRILVPMRELEQPPTGVVFHGVGLTLRLRSSDRFRSLQVELEPPTGVVVLAAILDALPPDALDDLSVTSLGPLSSGLVGSLRAASSRLKLTNVSLPTSAGHSRMK